MAPEKQLTRQQYMEWRKDHTNPDVCSFCDEDQQIVLKRYPRWTWIATLAPYRPMHTMYMTRRHTETIQELTVDEFLEFQQIHDEGRNILRRLGHKRIIDIWRQRDDRLHKSGAPNAMHLHIHLMPDTEDMLNNILSEGAADPVHLRRLREAIQ
jgi:diadenosine tetraphosphate (Ap4A) HIT family hydrolase